ncbi:hypothetical protein V2J09_013265 [Rumex salicifolius]
MALSTCLSHPRVFVKADRGILILRPRHKLKMEKKLSVFLDSSSQLFCQNNMGVGTNLGLGWSFVGGCKFAGRLNTDRLSLQKKRSGICSCLGTQFASCAFTLGTVAVLPFYTLMLFAPKSEITKKTMDSCIPYVVLGLVYVYLLYRSWTPDTIHVMFASKYWLPELTGIAKMFSNEMTLASAWIHLLVVDLFAARHVYQDGLKNDVETRHSVSLCLLTCPVGILSHTITKALINQKRNRD